jgi:acetyl-CoA synthetase
VTHAREEEPADPTTSFSEANGAWELEEEAELAEDMLDAEACGDNFEEIEDRLETLDAQEDIAEALTQAEAVGNAEAEAAFGSRALAHEAEADIDEIERLRVHDDLGPEPPGSDARIRAEPLLSPTVDESVCHGEPAPNLADYDTARASFSWSEARRALDGLPGGRGLNMAHECVDRHAAGPHGRRVALRFLGRRGQVRDVTYADLAELTSRFANVLDGLEVGVGERVGFLLGRQPELYVGVLGTLKHRSVPCALFSAFGPEPIRQRLWLGGAGVLVTTTAFYERKVAPVRDQLPGLRHVLLTDATGHNAPAGTCALGSLLDRAAADYVIGPTDPEDMALLHFTSGTTGAPKGAVHVHDAIVAHDATGYFALDLHADDVFWCTADPGWVTGISYGIVAPLAHGVTCVVDEADFDPERWYEILADQRVTVWYTAPTAVRMLMKAGADAMAGRDLSALRFVASVGEPLNPEAVLWGIEQLGLPIHDNWWQTETGGIMIANYRAMPVKPGSMGRPLPGIDAAILRRDNHGEIVVGNEGAAEVVEESGVEGELALRPGWPSMFRGYLGDQARYAQCFVGGWYRTGDLARRDEDGYFWFVGRADDVIKSAGHLIGPFEVESALMEHPAVSEAGVIGIPDPVAGEVVKAFVVLRAGSEPSDALRRELLGYGRQRLGAAVAPRVIDFRDELPLTRSGKIMRRLLRARELGLPEGDLSTLEGGAEHE